MYSTKKIQTLSTRSSELTWSKFFDNVFFMLMPINQMRRNNNETVCTINIKTKKAIVYNFLILINK